MLPLRGTDMAVSSHPSAGPRKAIWKRNISDPDSLLPDADCHRCWRTQPKDFLQRDFFRGAESDRTRGEGFKLREV